MPNCTQFETEFSALKRRVVETDFMDGDITSDGGALLLREINHRLQLSAAVAAALENSRHRAGSPCSITLQSVFQTKISS